jgi:GT2 family glycosyltransferase
VIVLNWNGEAYLAECLSSLRRQRYTGSFQVVVVDNGSQDGSVGLVQRDFPEVQLVPSSVNLGFSAGNNLAARRLDAELLAFLNNDTRADPGWLDELVSVVMEAPDVAAAGGRILSWDGKRVDFVGGGATLTGFGLQFQFGETPLADEPERDMLFACGGSMIVKRRPYLEVGGLDDDYFLFYEDVDLGWRLWLAGYRVRYAPRSITYHYHHGSTRRFDEARLAVLYERNALYTIYKNYDDRHLAEVLPAALLLTAERATTLAGLDRAPFLIPSGTPLSPPSSTPNGASRLRNWAKLRDSMRRRGIVATARRAAGAVRRRIAPSVAGARAGLGRRISGQRQSIQVPAGTISRMLALEAFGANLPMLQEKRFAVQKLRRRPDEEIIALFRTPLDPGFDAPGFGEYHRRLLHALKLDRWAEESSSQQRPVPHA